MLATHPNLTCSHDEPCNAQRKLLSSFITLYTISLCNLPSPTTKMHSVCFGFLGLFCIDRIEHNIFQLRRCHQHISSIFSQSLPPQKAVCFTSFHVELPHPYSQRSQHSHYTSQRHAKTSTVPECWSDPSGSFLAALVSFKVSSDVEPARTPGEVCEEWPQGLVKFVKCCKVTEMPTRCDKCDKASCIGNAWAMRVRHCQATEAHRSLLSQTLAIRLYRHLNKTEPLYTMLINIIHLIH